MLNQFTQNLYVNKILLYAIRVLLISGIQIRTEEKRQKYFSYKIKVTTSV